MNAQTQPANTRDRLIQTALDVFAEKGFQAATVAEICGAAGANIAAVNYHFGDKAGLYREAWRSAFETALDAFPRDEGVALDASAEDRLRAMIRSLLYRLGAVGPAECLQRLHVHEQLNPTGLVRRSRDQAMRGPLHDTLREIMGPDADDLMVDLCALSVMAQCRAVLPLNRREHRFFEKRRLTRPLIEQLADHVTRFSMAGIGEYASSKR